MRILPNYQDIALDATVFATGLTVSAIACKSALPIIERHFDPSVALVAGALSGPAAIMGTLAFVKLIQWMPDWYSRDNLQKVRWRFFEIGTLATALTSFVALRFFKESYSPHTSWGYYGLGLQAGLCLAGGMVYTRLVNKWATGLITNPSTVWTPERIRDVASAIDDNGLLELADAVAFNGPIQIVIDWLPAERVEALLKLLLKKNTACFFHVFEHVLSGRTRYKPAQINNWVQLIVESIDNAPLDKIKRYCDHALYLDKQKHILALVEAYRKRNNPSFVDLQKAFQKLVFESEEEFLDCASWNVQPLSERTKDDLLLMPPQDGWIDQFRRCLLHLMSSDAERQIQILDSLSLGPHYICHTNHPASDNARFHYPRLAEGTIDDLMKKMPPTVWDLAICARQRESVRARLAKLSPQELLPLADFRGDPETGCADVHTSCWDNERCWDDSLIKVAFEALPADKRGLLLSKLDSKSVWNRFATKFTLNIEPKEETMLAWTKVHAVRLEQINKYMQPTMYKLASFPRVSLPSIGLIIQYIKPRLLFTKGGCFKLDPVTDSTRFSKLPTDVFNMFCKKYLYPAERICLAAAFDALHYRIYSEKGITIWVNEGSVRAAIQMQELSDKIEATENFSHNQRIINEILARVWPRNFWPASKKPEWIKPL